MAIICTFGGRIDLAPYCIFASVILDFLDGFIARLLKVQGELGKQLDSLADMVTFGLAPGLMLVQLIKLSFWCRFDNPDVSNEILLRNLSGINGMCENPGLTFSPESLCHDPMYHYFPFIALIIPIMAMFRLAKFNMNKSQSDSFKGLPTPAMTLFFAAIPLMLIFQDTDWQAMVTGYLMRPGGLVILSLIFGVLMVIPLPLFALKFKSFGWKGNGIRYIFLTISAALLATLFVWALPLIIILYILLSVINNLLNKSKNEVQSGN